MTIRLFCEPLSLCPRTRSFQLDDLDMIVFCFAERLHAEHFREHSVGSSSIRRTARSDPAQADSMRPANRYARERGFSRTPTAGLKSGDGTLHIILRSA